MRKVVPPVPLCCVSPETSGLDRRLLEDDARRGDVSGLRDAISPTTRRAFLGTLILPNWSTPRKRKPLVNSRRTTASHTRVRQHTHTHTHTHT
jgi:hypothetical protein